MRNYIMIKERMQNKKRECRSIQASRCLIEEDQTGRDLVKVQYVFDELLYKFAFEIFYRNIRKRSDFSIHKWKRVAHLIQPIWLSDVHIASKLKVVSKVSFYKAKR